MTKHYPSGLYPADTAPAHNRIPMVADPDAARFSNVAAGKPKPTRRMQGQAAFNALVYGDREIAEMLGVADLYDLIEAARLELAAKESSAA